MTLINEYGKDYYLEKYKGEFAMTNPDLDGEMLMRDIKIEAQKDY